MIEILGATVKMYEVIIGEEDKGFSRPVCGFQCGAKKRIQSALDIFLYGLSLSDHGKGDVHFRMLNQRGLLSLGGGRF